VVSARNVTHKEAAIILPTIHKIRPDAKALVKLARTEAAVTLMPIQTQEISALKRKAVQLLVQMEIVTVLGRVTHLAGRLLSVIAIQMATVLEIVLVPLRCAEIAAIAVLAMSRMIKTAMMLTEKLILVR
jgi:hypothetical protein